jgi:tRNA nucleotidyltransferase/poly(A) polymerase
MPVKNIIAIEFIHRIISGSKYEGKVYIAGGAVRDEIMGFVPKDIDLLINEENGGINFANWITAKLGCFSTDTNPVVFPKFGTAKFNMRGVIHKGFDLSDVDIECVMPRKEKYTYGDRNPEVESATLSEDVMRRDFTINTLLKNISTGEVVDLTGKGISDIRRKLICTPLSPNHTFVDDPLRMLRAIRFNAKLGFDIEFHTSKALYQNCRMLQYISIERINDEFSKMLVSPRPIDAIVRLIDTGLIDFIAPELKDLEGVIQKVYHDHDALNHSLFVMSKTEPKIVNRLAGLFHDIGKPKAKCIGEDGKVHFYGHADISEEIARDILKRLKYSGDITDSVCLIIKNHMRLKSCGELAENLSHSALRRFRVDMGDDLIAALDVMHADNVSHGILKDMPYQIPMIRSMISNMNFDMVTKPSLPINGFDVMTIFGIQKPCRRVGEILKLAETIWYENPEVTKEVMVEKLKSTLSTEEE